MEDGFLIQQVLKGNSSAFKFLVHRYRRPVFKFLKGFGLGEAVIEDLAQEAFLRAFKNLAQYSADRASFSSWLFQITKNLALNELDKAHRSWEVPEDESETAIQEVDLNSDQHRLLESKESQEMMDSAMGKLPLPFRNAVVLSCLKELSLEEIARIEECSVGTVKSRIFRGKELLRSLILKRAEA